MIGPGEVIFMAMAVTSINGEKRGVLRESPVYPFPSLRPFENHGTPRFIEIERE